MKGTTGRSAKHIFDAERPKALDPPPAQLNVARLEREEGFRGLGFGRHEQPVGGFEGQKLVPHNDHTNDFSVKRAGGWLGRSIWCVGADRGIGKIAPQSARGKEIQTAPAGHPLLLLFGFIEIELEMGSIWLTSRGQGAPAR